jgi:hypothetical protein
LIEEAVEKKVPAALEVKVALERLKTELEKARPTPQPRP